MNKNKKYKAIIFDMDGTIVDTEKGWFETVRRYLLSKGLNDEEKISYIYKKIRGLAGIKIAEIIKENANLKGSNEEIFGDLLRISQEAYREKIDFIDGFIEFFEILRKNNIPVAIATNASAHGLAKTDEQVNLRRFFGDHMYSIACIGDKCKPLPDIYLHAAKQINICPTECIAIEDSAHGVSAAVSAGMYCIAINTSKVERDHLAHAHSIVDAYKEIKIEDLLEFNKNQN